MSSKNNLSIELTAREDKQGKTYYIGKLHAPVQIDCTEGIVFLVFTSDPGSEVLQLGPIDNSKEKRHTDQ